MTSLPHPRAARSLRLHTRIWLGTAMLTGFSFLFLLLQPQSFIDATVLRMLYLPSALVAGWLITRWVANPLEISLATLTTGMHGFKDGDFSFRLAPPPQPEIASLIERFNALGDVLRDERATIYQKELLLDTVIQSAPMAILLVGSQQRIILANAEAQTIFRMGKPLTGMALEELMQAAPEAIRQGLGEQHALVDFETMGDREIYHISRQGFHLHGLGHQLLIIKRLTKELKRQEVATWKKLIRLINHELNNALAPLQSLLNSSGKILKDAPQFQRVEPLFQTMRSTIEHLVGFLQHYATFARLPNPLPQNQPWQSFLQGLQALMPFELENQLTHSQGYFDAGQLQQVLLNLLKNAREASPEHHPVTLRLQNTHQGGTIIQVLDRGKGMGPEQLQKALLPFYSTKHGGTGLGLALAREILEAHDGSIRLEQRIGGGLAVTCTLPPPQKTFTTTG